MQTHPGLEVSLPNDNKDKPTRMKEFIRVLKTKFLQQLCATTKSI